MIKKLLVICSILAITSCNANNNNLPVDLEQNNDINAQANKNVVMSYSISSGDATFVFNKSGSGEPYVSTNPSIVVNIKKLGIKFNRFNKASLKMPNGSSVDGYFYIANDSNLYLQDYESKKYYKVGTWSKKDKFKGKGYINLKDTSYNLWSQDFDIKMDSTINKIEAETHINPMAHEYLFLGSNSNIQPTQKVEADFNLANFISNK
ncbi:MAG: hypothetical protein U0457_06970 [Candidatus Sericytochromatia bacterium]